MNDKVSGLCHLLDQDQSPDMLGSVGGPTSGPGILKVPVALGFWRRAAKSDFDSLRGPSTAP